MTKQEYRQESAHWQKQINHAQRKKDNLKRQYINEHAPYPLKSLVKAENNGKIGEFIIDSYNLDENLIITPNFTTKQGRIAFMSRPVIFGLVKE